MGIRRIPSAESAGNVGGKKMKTVIEWLSEIKGGVGETLASGYHCRCGHREDFGK